MNNLDTLFEKNFTNKYRVKLDKNGGVHYIDSKEYFNGSTLIDILNFVNSVRSKYKTQKIPIYFEFTCKDIRIQDKLAYIIFECICYSLKKENRIVYVYWDPKYEIITQGVRSSPLKHLNTHDRVENEKFVKNFKNKMYKSHFRKLISFSKKEDLKSNYLGVLQQEIDLVLGIFEMSVERIDKISEVIVELVGNAGEHGESDCLIDIDITEDYTKIVKNIEQEGRFYGINIAIVGFSDKLLGDGIKKKIYDNMYDEGRYQYLSGAFNNHVKMMKCNESNNSVYNEEYFWNIAALQDRISGRQDKDVTGGTGMTVLISGLQKEADNDSCYMLSGNKLIYFKKEFIDFDSDKWLGFNYQKDFINYIPDQSILGASDVYIPGTAYNLNFVMRKEEDK